MILPYHVLINSAFGYAYQYSSHDIAILAISGAAIDLDHLFYFLASQKTLSVSKIRAWGKENYKFHQPFPYIFHTLEFLFLFNMFARILHNHLLMTMSVGFAIHLLCDAIVYLKYYKSYRPWLRYFFPSSKFLYNKIKS